MELIDLKRFIPSNAGETAALEAFVALEANNRPAFTTTYYQAYKRGLPVDRFYQFTSEIEQDRTIRNRGAVFNKKVNDFLTKHK